MKIWVDPQETYWAKPTIPPDWLVKLYSGQEYDESDQVPRLGPSISQTTEPISSDPGILDTMLYNYTCNDLPDITGLRSGGMVTDDVLAWLIKQLQELYFRCNLSEYLTLHTAASTKSLMSGMDVGGFEREMLWSSHYNAFLVHLGKDATGHYVCAILDTKRHTFYIYDSIAVQKGIPTKFGKEARCGFRAMYNSVFPDDDKPNPKFIFPATENQGQTADCGLYAIHNMHRFTHLLHYHLARGESVDNKGGMISQTPQLGPLNTLGAGKWRLKILENYLEACRLSVRITKVPTVVE